jgi:hypothetical protein
MATKTVRGPRRSHKRLDRVHRNRRDNLRRVFKEMKALDVYPTVREFCGAFAQAPAIYYAVAGPNPTKTMGEGLARDIEYRLNLPMGSLDLDPKA